jgi:hypothetical protein
MAAVSAISRSRRLAIMETATTPGRLQSHMATRYSSRGSGKLAPLHYVYFHRANRRVRFALHDHQTRRRVPARFPASPDCIVSRLCGQMAVVLGQRPHVGTVGGQRDGRVVGSCRVTVKVARHSVAASTCENWVQTKNALWSH